MTKEQEKARETKGARRRRVSPLFVIAITVFLACLIAIAVIAVSYLQGQLKYRHIAENAELEQAQGNLAQFKVDWDALLAANPDTVAWLYIPNTAINYPVVRAEDNDYYLTHDFDGVQGWLANFGTIFMDYRNNPDWSDQGYFIYGHHMNDGSMFADIAGMREQWRFDECRTVYLLSPRGNFKLRSFALVHTNADDALVQTGFSSAQEMQAYIQDKIDRSVVSGGDIASVKAMKKVFALATCDNVADGRYVLFAYIDETDVNDLVGTVGVGIENDEPVGLHAELAQSEQPSQEPDAHADEQLKEQSDEKPDEKRGIEE